MPVAMAHAVLSAFASSLEPFRRNEKNVHIIVPYLIFHTIPFVLVAGIDGDGPDATLRSRNLVSDKRQ